MIYENKIKIYKNLLSKNIIAFFLKKKIFLNLIKYIIIIIIYLYFYYSIHYLKIISDPSCKEISQYIKDNLAGKLFNNKSEFYKRDYPLISIVISTFNGEVYLKPAVRSIQNQNFLDLEIIIVNDGSMDNTLKVVNELMEEDHRIKLISNSKNRGTLYTKTKGVLNTNGKYVMTLDHDNLYSTNYVFSMLYHESEKFNLDLLGFSTISTPVEVTKAKYKSSLNYFKTPIIRKPKIKRRFTGFIKKLESGTYLCLYFIKQQLFLNIIKQLGREFLFRNIDAHDDTILMFLLSRNALSLKHEKAIFYIVFEWPESYKKALEFQLNTKKRERERKNCYSYLTFIEVVFRFTQNNYDKYIAERCFQMWFLEREQCKKEIETRNYAIKICNLFLNNEYISPETKSKISIYLNQTNN